MKKLILILFMLFSLLTTPLSLATSAAASGSFQGIVSTAGGRLNIRRSPSMKGAIIKSINNKTVLPVHSKSGEWYKVEYSSGKYGYCHEDYIKKYTPTAKFRKISFSVPSYKQKDSRWKNVPIGSYGDTIGTIGCTTTTLAMTESFRTGKTINPKNMRDKLSYSPSGSLYWPSNYKTELVNSENYLSKIYNLLKEGKPVILGAKGKTQHWVVVTGHTKNTSTLNPANFKINDPGSNSRVSLSSFLSSYPTVYKIAYHK